MDNKDNLDLPFDDPPILSLDTNKNKIKQYSKQYIKRLTNSPTILTYKKLINQSGGYNFSDTYKRYNKNNTCN